MPYDLVMRNARVVDGTGSPWYRGDIAIRGDTIARIAPSITEAATRIIDLGDLVAAPGFIDIHTHAGRTIFQVPTADNYIRQGVTTIMEGADGAGSSIAGSAPIPLKPFLDRLEALPKSINIGSFIGQGAVREAVIGLANRPASSAELDSMRNLVLQGMRDGAFGLSTGLFYVPGAFTPLEEVVELQKVVAPFRGVHTSHMRDEASHVVESVNETIAIGELGGVPTHVSHHKVIGKAYWGKSTETLQLIDAARARGVDVTMDQYPYTVVGSGRSWRIRAQADFRSVIRSVGFSDRQSPSHVACQILGAIRPCEDTRRPGRGPFASAVCSSQSPCVAPDTKRRVRPNRRGRR